MNTIETAALAELNAMIDAAQAKADALVAKLDALKKKITDREKRVAPYARKRKVSPVARRSAQPKNTMKTKMTPSEESARFDKLAGDINAAIYKLVGELALEIGKSPADVLEINSKVSDAGTSACMMAFDEILP
jgi:uncharacterized coiled-coil protein SlyX